MMIQNTRISFFSVSSAKIRDSSLDETPQMLRLSHKISRLAYTLWLFTLSDLKTTVIPSTVFGLVNAYTASVFGLHNPAESSSSQLVPFLTKLAYVTFWTWIHVLAFDADNQRQPQAILEDQVNKPWRPLPSGRMHGSEARILAFVAYILSGGVAYGLGGLHQSIGLAFLGFLYNDLGGGSRFFASRNLLNAGGFACFISGALEVALNASPFTSTKFNQWLLIIAAVVFTTIHVQDMSDQPGDRLRNRKTLPLVLGDGEARASIGLLMMFWSWACPMYWGLPWSNALAFVILGHLIGIRTCTKRKIQDDKWTFRLWNLWMIILYLIPTMKLWSIVE